MVGLHVSTVAWALICLRTACEAYPYVIGSAQDAFINTYVFTDGRRAATVGINREFNASQETGYNTAENAVTCLLLDDTLELMDTADGTVRVLDSGDMDVVMDICQYNTAVNKQNRRHKRFILPGTKWCGLGNVASDYTELGSDEQTDRCCRTHDHCPDHIAPFQTKNGITNLSFLYRFNCECEETFHSCLQAVTNENAASIVGRLYFNLIQPTCFRIDHPTKCQRKGWWFVCKEKVLDRSKPKGWGFYKFGKQF